MNGKALMDIAQDPVELDIEVLVDPAAEVIRQSTVAPGIGILYRYQPGAEERLAEGLPRFIESGPGRLVLARSGREIVGYAVITRPDPRERWGDPGAPELWELGFIEVARGWRQRGIGRKLLHACFADGAFEDRIVLATAYAWHWDLEGTGLSKSAYRRVLDECFRPEGFEPFNTDEPNIREDPANRLLVRIGPRVPVEIRARFERLLKSPRDTGPIWSPLWWLAPWARVWEVAAWQISKSLEWWIAPLKASRSIRAKQGPGPH